MMGSDWATRFSLNADSQETDADRAQAMFLSSPALKKRAFILPLPTVWPVCAVKRHRQSIKN